MVEKKSYIIPGELNEAIFQVFDWYKSHKEDYSFDMEYDIAMERLVKRAEEVTSPEDIISVGRWDYVFCLKDIMHIIMQEGLLSEHSEFIALYNVIRDYTA